MKLSKEHIREIVHKVISEDRDPLKDILDHNDTEDVVHATHLSWDGGEKGGPESENLVMPIDHSKAVGSDPVTRGPEVIDHSDEEVKSVEDRGLSLENAIRRIVRSLL